MAGRSTMKDRDPESKFRTYTAQMRVTLKELNQIKRKAKRGGYNSVSDFLRAIALDDAPAVLDPRKREATT